MQSNPMITQCVKNFLLAKTWSDLAALYNHDTEVQILVAQDNGERVDTQYKGKQYQCYSDGIQKWYPIRIPKNANTEPEYIDKEMPYNLEAHAAGIGLTGWDWKVKRSKWIGFDFDSIIGHKHSKGLTDDEIKEIINKVSDIP